MDKEKVQNIGYKAGYIAAIIVLACIVAIVVAFTIWVCAKLFGGM